MNPTSTIWIFFFKAIATHQQPLQHVADWNHSACQLRYEMRGYLPPFFYFIFFYLVIRIDRQLQADSCGLDKTVIIWDWEAGACHFSPPSFVFPATEGHLKWLSSLTFHKMIKRLTLSTTTRVKGMKLIN